MPSITASTSGPNRGTDKNRDKPSGGLPLPQTRGQTKPVSRNESSSRQESSADRGNPPIEESRVLPSQTEGSTLDDSGRVASKPAPSKNITADENDLLEKVTGLKPQYRIKGYLRLSDPPAGTKTDPVVTEQVRRDMAWRETKRTRDLSLAEKDVVSFTQGSNQGLQDQLYRQKLMDIAGLLKESEKTKEEMANLLVENYELHRKEPIAKELLDRNRELLVKKDAILKENARIIQQTNAALEEGQQAYKSLVEENEALKAHHLKLVLQAQEPSQSNLPRTLSEADLSTTQQQLFQLQQEGGGLGNTRRKVAVSQDEGGEGRSGIEARAPYHQNAFQGGQEAVSQGGQGVSSQVSFSQTGQNPSENLGESNQSNPAGDKGIDRNVDSSQKPGGGGFNPLGPTNPLQEIEVLPEEGGGGGEAEFSFSGSRLGRSRLGVFGHFNYRDNRILFGPEFGFKGNRRLAVGLRFSSEVAVNRINPSLEQETGRGAHLSFSQENFGAVQRVELGYTGQLTNLYGRFETTVPHRFPIPVFGYQIPLVPPKTKIQVIVLERNAWTLLKFWEWKKMQPLNVERFKDLLFGLPDKSLLLVGPDTHKSPKKFVVSGDFVISLSRILKEGVEISPAKVLKETLKSPFAFFFKRNFSGTGKVEPDSNYDKGLPHLNGLERRLGESAAYAEQTMRNGNQQLVSLVKAEVNQLSENQKQQSVLLNQKMVNLEQSLDLLKENNTNSAQTIVTLLQGNSKTGLEKPTLVSHQGMMEQLQKQVNTLQAKQEHCCLELSGKTDGIQETVDCLHQNLDKIDPSSITRLLALPVLLSLARQAVLSSLAGLLVGICFGLMYLGVNGAIQE